MAKRKPEPPTEGYATNSLSEVRMVPIGLIDEPELPSREGMDMAAMEELKASMREIGLLSPVVVVSCGSRYQVVAGHRRLLAARDLEWEQLRCLVYPEGWTDSPAAMLHENVVREELNAAQEAIFFQQLLERHKLDEEGLCRLVKRSPHYVADRIKLLRGDDRVFDALRKGLVTLGVARILNRFDNPDDRGYYLHQAVTSGTNARVVEEWYRAHVANRQPSLAPASEPAPPSPEVEAAPHVFECFLCGGSRDPYNLVTVQIHKWELAEIQRRMTHPLDEPESELLKPKVN